MHVSKQIGKNIVALRMQKGITQEHLALYSDVSVTYLRSIEYGRANPSVQLLARLADTLEEPFSTVTYVYEPKFDNRR
ncbi:MAG: helix-turn-helix transcriptional regulator [Oscillospiraceae bacterium]|nr:helix-turn-helix transcriptional regulator [Oscillospiraceae bacterium]MBQ9958961.1 helix-turn-helix transcriptional regulator [Oscillospiraceae bacterium]